MNDAPSCDYMCERQFCLLCFFFLVFVASTYLIDETAGPTLRGVSHLSLPSKARMDTHPAGRTCLRQLADLRGGVRNFSSCHHRLVHRLVDFIDSAAAVDIRVFPRNGLLLGIVRHHGFLPFENPVDFDLGIMYSDLENMRAVNFQFESVRGEGIYRLIMDTKLPNWNVGSWDGGCKCGEKLWQVHSECMCDAILEPGATVVFEGQWTFYVDFVYPYDSKKLFYPLWSSSKNLMPSIRETRRWKREGSAAVVLGAPPNSPYQLNRGNLGTLFDRSSFDSFVKVPFYDRMVTVPAGFCSILKAYYGSRWMYLEKRENWESKRINSTDYSPKQLCGR